MTKNSFALVMAGAGLALCAAAATAETAPPPAPAEASIPFANHGGILNWRADRDRGLYVQDSRRQWYYAKFMGSCPGVDFANGLGFNTKPMGTFDKWSTVVVPGEGSCFLQSVVASDGPPSKKDLRTAKVTPIPAESTDASSTADRHGGSH
jgi:hypothetical protein